MTKISAVIPAYNEAQRIGKTIALLEPFVDEILVVDDASEDDTPGVAARHGARVIMQPDNRGYIEAIKLGIRQARGEVIVTLDADGEFSPEYIPDLTEPILDGSADMVQGHRNMVPRPSERFLSWLAQRRALVGDSGTGLRAIRSELAKSLEIRGACICGVLSLEVAASGGRIEEIPIVLQKVEKPRKIAWFHLRQLFYLLPWLMRRSEWRNSGKAG